MRSRNRLEVEHLGRLADPARALVLGHALHLQREAHVFGDGLVRVQRVVLEHHRDVAVLGRHTGHVLAVDADRPVVDLLQAGQHPQRGGLARTRRADQDHELAVVDVQLEASTASRSAPA